MTETIATRLKVFVAGRGLRDTVILLATLITQFSRGLANGYVFVFIGKGVTLRGRDKIKIGKFSRIEDFAELDGYGSKGITLGERCKVGKYSIIRVPPTPFTQGAGVTVGDDTTFAEFCFVGGASQVTIGKANSVGQYVSIHPENHLPVRSDGIVQTTSKGILIGNDNWIGAKATILDGSRIDDRSQVAACALVNTHIPSNVLVAGVPAKVKKTLA